MRRTSWPVALLAASMSVLGVGACSNAPTIVAPPGLTITSPTGGVDVAIWDSVSVSVTAVDPYGTPIKVAPTVTNDFKSFATVLQVRSDTDGTTSFWLRGLAYGTGYLTLTVGDVDTTMPFRSLPARIDIAGLADSLQSGVSGQPYLVPRDIYGDSVPLPGATFRWISWDSTRLSVDSVTGAVTPYALGTAWLTARGPRGMWATTRMFHIIPGPIPGTVSPTTVGFADTLRVRLDAPIPGTEAYLGGAVPWVVSHSPSGFVLLVPTVPKPGSYYLTLPHQTAGGTIVLGAQVNVDSIYPGYHGPDSVLVLPVTTLPHSVYLSLPYGAPQYVRVQPSSDTTLAVTIAWQAPFWMAIYGPADTSATYQFTDSTETWTGKVTGATGGIFGFAQGWAPGLPFYTPVMVRVTVTAP